MKTCILENHGTMFSVLPQQNKELESSHLLDIHLYSQVKKRNIWKKKWSIEVQK